MDSGRQTKEVTVSETKACPECGRTMNQTGTLIVDGRTVVTLCCDGMDTHRPVRSTVPIQVRTEGGAR